MTPQEEWDLSQEMMDNLGKAEIAVGNIVHYRHQEKCRAAIVVNLDPVNLWVFPNEDRALDYARGMTDVQEGPPNEAGSWHWPRQDGCR